MVSFRDLDFSSTVKLSFGLACYGDLNAVLVDMCKIIYVVAFLLDNFSRAVANEKIKAIQELELEEGKSQMKALGLSKADSANPLDPQYLEILSRFRNSVSPKLLVFCLCVSCSCFHLIGNELECSFGIE